MVAPMGLHPCPEYLPERTCGALPHSRRGSECDRASISCLASRCVPAGTGLGKVFVPGCYAGAVPRMRYALCLGLSPSLPVWQTYCWLLACSANGLPRHVKGSRHSVPACSSGRVTPRERRTCDALCCCQTPCGSGGDARPGRDLRRFRPAVVLWSQLLMGGVSSQVEILGLVRGNRSDLRTRSKN